MNTPKKAANAVGGKTARACESCLHKRARWYCAADDAFLCHGCDTSVHSANQLASRHKRVRLELKPSSNPINCSPPAWHLGFTRKARTPRHAKPMQPPKGVEEENITNSLPLVPEMGGEDASIWPEDENEEQLLYRVPIFNPFDGELSNEDERAQKIIMGDEFDVLLSDELENLHGFFSSDLDLKDFAADVESLLGTRLDEDSCGIEGLGLLDCKEEEDGMDMGSEEGRRVKVEDEDVEAVTDCQLETIIDWNFDCESPVAGEEEKVVAEMETATVNGGCKKEVKSKIVLRLDYEAVISAWASQGCPWTTGVRPDFNPDDYWPDFMGWCRRGYSHPCGGGVRGDDGGREARVSRYREKRRTRLFSKKIRYQVRKLNAEKRPRMKGRFVKRSSFALTGPAFPYLINNKK